MSFMDGFSQGAGVVLSAKRLKADREDRAKSREDRAAEIKLQLEREERQDRFQKEQLTERIKADTQRDRQQRLYKMEDDMDRTIERSQDRSGRERLLSAQVGALDRQGQPRPQAPVRPAAPTTPFGKMASDLDLYDKMKSSGIQEAVAALDTGDIEKITPTQEKLSRITSMDPLKPATPKPEMGELEMPYGSEEDIVAGRGGKAKMRLPLDEIKAAVGMIAAQQTPPMSPGVGPGTAQVQGGAKPLTAEDQQAIQWARANPNDPRAQAILQKHFNSAR